MPKTQINGISLYYENHGKGEPVVLIAGFGADHTLWNETVELLKDTHQVIVLDNRGAGQSDAPKEPYSIEQMAKDTAMLCKSLGIQKTHFVGNSMGGFILQTLAYQYPDLVQSAIISNSTDSIQCCFNIYVGAQLELLKAGAPLSALIKASSSWVFSYHYLSHPGILDALLKIGLENPFPFTITGYEGQCAALDGFDATPWAGKIKVPVLVISGAEDLIFSEISVRRLADKIPGAEYYCFDQCGHLPMLEYPEKFVSVIRKFLS